MNINFDIERIKAEYSIRSVVERLGLSRKGPRYFCPSCQPQGTEAHETPDLVLYDETAHCFRCGETFDQISLVQSALGLSFKNAVEYIVGGPQLSIRETRVSSMKPSKLYNPQLNSRELDRAGIWQSSQDELERSPQAEAYLHDRGFALGQVLGFVGYLPHGQWANSNRDPPGGRIVFPHYSFEDPNNVLNLYGRALEPIEKALRHDHGPGPKGFWSPDPAAAMRAETLVITEGAFDALAVHLARPDLCVVAVFGIHGFQFQRFPKASDILFAFDNDETGLSQARRLAGVGALVGRRCTYLNPEHYQGFKDLANRWQKQNSLFLPFD